TGIRINGQAVGEDGTWSISDQKLSKDAAQKKEYPFYVPAELKELVKIQIVAEPDESSQGATDSQKLAAVLTLSSLEPTENWTGEFIDDKSIDVDEYDGFNYEISGNGEGTVTLTWPDKLQISSWFLDDVGAYDITQDGTTGNWSAKFAVGGTTTGADGSEVAAPTAYQFQIYRNSDKDTMSWNEMESQVTVEFEPKTTE
ncbi:MAG: hypothetical protein ACI4EF_03645, partial [Coprococcus sp.]